MAAYPLSVALLSEGQTILKIAHTAGLWWKEPSGTTPSKPRLRILTHPRTRGQTSIQVHSAMTGIGIHCTALGAEAFLEEGRMQILTLAFSRQSL